MTTSITRIAALLMALAAALFLSSCGSSADTSADGHADHQSSEEPVISGEPAGFNDADVAFMTDMIPHHEQAVELSALVPERSTNPEVTALAEQISAAQEPEIQTMKVLLVQWTGNSGSGHAGHSGAMQGMVDDATMARLQSLSGSEFDTLWLQSMISHHEGAIDMAEAEIANGENVDAKTLAQSIIDGQQAEIAQMNQMLGSGQ